MVVSRRIVRRAVVPSPTLAPGSRIAERFEIEALAGSGGMGDVYRAHDLRRGGTVALKMLRQRANNALAVERFTQEAALLAELRHPGVVAYVAHGETAEGQLYLAMEWLEGEDLAARLARGPLTVDEAMILLRRTAEALEAAHRLGIVHRDLKPHNLFLRQGVLERVTILDFGVARRAMPLEALTHAGRLIGTPGYMAPEQVRGDVDVGPASDVFSLGCVIHECLAGAPPFAGEHVAAVLARILFEDPRSLRSLVPPPPDSVCEIVERLLAKNPARRPNDATALLRDLDLIGDGALPRPSQGTTLPPQVYGEQEVCSVVLAVRPAGATGDAHTIDVSVVHAADAVDDSLVEALGRLGAAAEKLPDGALVAAITRGTSAADRAEIAAHAALLVHAQWPGARVALATGRGIVRRALPVGEAVDKAARLLATSQPSDHVIVDTLSGDLLEGRLVVDRADGRRALTSERSAAEEARPLLGRRTTCVGREQELALLEALYAACTAESQVAAALVTAPSGAGKSRLRHELLRRLTTRSPELVVLHGRGELMTAGSPYGILGRALRALAGVKEGEPAVEARGRLFARLGRHVPAAERRRVVEMLGEMCGVPFPGEESPRLRTARAEPLYMNEQIRLAFVDFLRAECEDGPRLLLIEDLHWGDALGVDLVEAALRELSDQPLMVLALARPEVHDLFPRLRHGAIHHEIALPGLSKKASGRLVREVLPNAVPAVVDRIVEQAAGNALFLEELIRAEASGTGERSPDTVLATLEVRLSLLDPEARRVLRAASVFGQTFRLAGVASLLGKGRSSEGVDLWLDRLTDEEIVERQRDARSPEKSELRFHHSLVREAAYALLTDEERASFHLSAASFLVEGGERDPIVLAEHFQRGGALDRAAHHYMSAAEQSYGSNDLDGTMARVQRGLACKPTGEVLGVLRQLQAIVLGWRLEWAQGYEAAREARSLLVPGSYWWCKASWSCASFEGIGGREEGLAESAREVLGVRPRPEARSVYVECLGSLLWSHAARGRRPAATALLARIQEVVDGATALEPSTRGSACRAEAEYLRAFAAEPERVRVCMEAALAAFSSVNNHSEEVVSLTSLAQALADLGRFREAEERMDRVARHPFLTASYMAAFVKIHRAALLVASGEPSRMEQGAVLSREILATAGVSSGYRAWASTMLAEVELARGELASAEALSRAALDPTSTAAVRRLLAVSTLSRTLARMGRTDEARATIEEGLRWLVEQQVEGYAEMPVRLAVVEARRAAGDASGAREALESANARIEARARSIPDEDERAAYLTGSLEARWAARLRNEG
ncbi:MAG: protein kinase [Polyangiaceae bacterium]